MEWKKNNLTQPHYLVMKNRIIKRCYKYIFLRSDGDVMRLHWGQSFLAPRVRSQHSSQCTCQHCMETRGLLYLSIHMRHLNDDSPSSKVGSSKTEAVKNGLYNRTIPKKIEKKFQTWTQISNFKKMHGMFQKWPENGISIASSKSITQVLMCPHQT